jgi:allantoinase
MPLLPGISTVGLGLSVLWTEGQNGGITLPETSNWTSYKTAKQVGLLGKRVPWCRVGMRILYFDPEAQFKVSTFLAQPSCADGVTIQVTTSDMHFKNKVIPYENKTLHGRVCETWLRGWKIYSIDTGFDKGGPGGELLVDRREHLN